MHRNVLYLRDKLHCTKEGVCLTALHLCIKALSGYRSLKSFSDIFWSLGLSKLTQQPIKHYTFAMGLNITDC